MIKHVFTVVKYVFTTVKYVFKMVKYVFKMVKYVFKMVMALPMARANDCCVCNSFSGSYIIIQIQSCLLN